MKPYVICHMNASVDGRILGSRWRPAENRMAGLFERLHEQLGGGSWLIGRVTGSNTPGPLPIQITPTRPICGNPGCPDVTPAAFSSLEAFAQARCPTHSRGLEW